VRFRAPLFAGVLCAAAVALPARAQEPEPGGAEAPTVAPASPVSPGSPGSPGSPVSFGERLAEVVRRFEAREIDAALAVATELAALPDLDERSRARARFALGYVRAHAGDATERVPAAEAFASARALAGPGPLRLDATYDQGGVHLAIGEEWRGRIPEIAQANGGAAQGPGALPPGAVPTTQAAPGRAAPGQAAPGQDEDPPDPLTEARAAYLRARAALVERLRADWRDADTRANLELIQRRLAELDDIEREREEQEEEQQDEQQQDQEQDSEDSQESDDSEDSQDSQDSDESQDGEDGDSQDENAQEPPPEDEGAEPEEEEPEPEEEQPGEEEASEEERPEEGEPQEPEQADGDAGEVREAQMTDEEVQRLLDRLAELEEEARAMKARLREARRVPVARDW